MSSGRPRGSHGRFISSGNADCAERMRRTAQRQIEQKNLETADRLFSGLLSAVMIRGNPDEAIMASSSAGPLVFLAEGLLKKKYLLSRYSRCTKAREYYCRQNDMPLRRQDQLPTLSVSLLNGNKRKVCQRPIFKERRLPRLSGRSRETTVVWKWIDFAKGENALALDRVEAFKLFEAARDRFSSIKSSINYPLQRKGPRNRTQSSSLNPVGGMNAVIQEGSETTGAASNVPILGDVRYQSGTGQRDLDRENVRHQTDVTDEAVGEVMYFSSTEPAYVANVESELFARQTQLLIDTARCDKTFFLLCKVAAANTDNCTELACASAVFLKEIRASGLTCQGLLEDSLHYTVALKFGVKDLRAHEARRKRISCNVQALKGIRQTLKLSPFERMSWESACGAFTQARSVHGEDTGAVERTCAAVTTSAVTRSARTSAPTD